MFLKKRRLLTTRINREAEKRAALLEKKKRKQGINSSHSIPMVIAKDAEEVKIIDNITTTTTVAPLSKKYKKKGNK